MNPTILLEKRKRALAFKEAATCSKCNSPSPRMHEKVIDPAEGIAYVRVFCVHCSEQRFYDILHEDEIVRYCKIIIPQGVKYGKNFFRFKSVVVLRHSDYMNLAALNAIQELTEQEIKDYQKIPTFKPNHKPRIFNAKKFNNAQTTHSY